MNMDYIFLDTSIFVKENFLEGGRIRELMKLSEERKINIVMTKITIEEVKVRFKKQIKKALEEFGKFKNNYDNIVLKNDIHGKDIFQRLYDKPISEKFNSDLDELLLRSNVIIIDYSEINVEPIFEKYFKGQYPFNNADKKNEFPDAFSLALLEKWCNKKKIKCTCFSTDKDFLGYISPVLFITKDYENYLNNKLKEILEEERVEVLDEIFETNSDRIDEEIIKWYTQSLDDETLYYHFIYYEIHNLKVTDITILEKSYQIISIEEECIEIEIDVELSYYVELTIDDEENSYYDDEEKIMHFYGVRIEPIERTTTATVTALAYITDKNDYDKFLEITEINKDVSLKISPHDYEY